MLDPSPWGQAPARTCLFSLYMLELLQFGLQPLLQPWHQCLPSYPLALLLLQAGLAQGCAGCPRYGPLYWQGCAAAKSLAALAGKVRLAVAGKFPIIPKGYSGLVQQLLAVPSHWWNYGELWGNYGGNWVELWELWWNYGELWGSCVKLCGIMGIIGNLWGIMVKL